MVVKYLNVNRQASEGGVKQIQYQEQIERTDQREAYVIPASYIHRRYGLSFVYLSDGSEIVIQPGSKLATGIEVLSGLQNGDMLIHKQQRPQQPPTHSNNAGE